MNVEYQLERIHKYKEEKCSHGKRQQLVENRIEDKGDRRGIYWKEWKKPRGHEKRFQCR
jgi:hypothetical protein